MVDQHAAEFPQTQEARACHKANIGNLADTRCGSSAGVDESVVARARNLVPELRRRSEEIHVLGRIPRDLFDRLLAEGLFGLSTPQGYGGLQTNVKAQKSNNRRAGTRRSIRWLGCGCDEQRRVVPLRIVSQTHHRPVVRHARWLSGVRHCVFRQDPERDALLSNQRWLRANNPVGLVEADGYDPFWLLTRHQDVYEVSRQNSLTGEPKRSASTFVGAPKTLPVRFVLR